MFIQFFLDGYDSVAMSLAFTLHFLALNADVQEKAYEEVLEVDEKYGGNLNVDSMNDLKYIDNIFSETMRLTPFPFTFRYCTKDWKMAGTNVTIPKGMRVIIPLQAIQRDPKHFPDPERFDPDRFEKRSNIKAGTYLPFGGGPRQCVGMQLAHLEAKILLHHIIKRYYIEPCDKTLRNIQLSDFSPNFYLKEGSWVKFARR